MILIHIKLTNEKTCMYGGVTEHNGNHLDKYRSITVRVFEDGKNLLSFDVQN